MVSQHGETVEGRRVNSSCMIVLRSELEKTLLYHMENRMKLLAPLLIFECRILTYRLEFLLKFPEAGHFPFPLKTKNKERCIQHWAKSLSSVRNDHRQAVVYHNDKGYWREKNIRSFPPKHETECCRGFDKFSVFPCYSPPENGSIEATWALFSVHQIQTWHREAIDIILLPQNGKSVSMRPSLEALRGDIQDSSYISRIKQCHIAYAIASDTGDIGCPRRCCTVYRI